MVQVDEELLGERRVNIFFGRFGCGKTELAINCALKLASAGRKPVVVDLDMVTPYFRSREARDVLVELGVQVVAPPPRLSSGDLPALSGEALGVIQSAPHVLVDTGGEEIGLSPLASLRRFLKEGEYEAHFVVNARRPGTRDVTGIARSVRRLEEACGVRATCLVNNTNLMGLTSRELLSDGEAVVRNAASVLGLPVRFTSVVREWAAELPSGIRAPVLVLELFMVHPWEKG